MSTPRPHSGTGLPAIAPVGPSLIVRLLLGPMSRVLNPLVGTLAGRRHFLRQPSFITPDAGPATRM